MPKLKKPEASRDPFLYPWCGAPLHELDPLEIALRKRDRATSFGLGMLVCDRCERQEGAEPN